MHLITTAQAAAELGICRRRVQALISAGRLPAERFGRMLVIRLRDLELVRLRPMSARYPVYKKHLKRISENPE